MEKNNTAKMKELTNSLKQNVDIFLHLLRSTRERNPMPDFDIEILEDDDSASDILQHVAGILTDCSFLVSKAAFIVGLMEDDDEDGEDEEEPEKGEESCEGCPYEGQCGSEYGTMVLISRPFGDNSIMTTRELPEELEGFSVDHIGACDLKPVPGSENLYYTIPERKPLKRGGKTFYRKPAIIFGIDEEAGEVVSPNARQLFEAAQYFEKASTNIKTREGGETAAFCFD